MPWGCISVFDGDDELEGVEVGSSADFGLFRDVVQERLESGAWGSRFPTLMNHSDCDGEWSPADAAVLQAELATIARELAALAPVCRRRFVHVEI